MASPDFVDLVHKRRGRGRAISGLFLLLRCFLGWLESLSNGLDHLAEPDAVQGREGEVATQVDGNEPPREGTGFLRIHHDVFGTWQYLVRWCDRHELGVGCGVQGAVHVIPHDRGLPHTPDKAGREEGDNENDAIVQLRLASRLAHLVKEPVDVEERGR